MKKIAEIILDVCVAGWLLFVTASIVMILITSCESKSVESCKIQGDHYHDGELYTN